jgi:hypothetical protein
MCALLFHFQKPAKKIFFIRTKKKDLSPFSPPAQYTGSSTREAVMPKDTSLVDTRNVSAEEDLLTGASSSAGI